MRKLAGIFLFLIWLSTSAQQDNCRLRISLLTCTPGSELYSTFGHSALRVVDSSHQSDLVFNYGTFDFDDPDFYKKFIQGKLRYFLSVDSLPAFLWEYSYFKRGVTEQVIRMNCNEKQKLLTALLENAREENKYYRYDFTYDNCTTRLRDMLEKSAGNTLQTKNILPGTAVTFRQLIHEYLQRGGQLWSQLGIDILLGSPLDKKIANREAMFLPDYLMMAFDSSLLNGQPLVEEKKVLLEKGDFPQPKPLFTPLNVFLFLFILITLLSILQSSKRKLFFQLFDFFFFFSLGILGVLLLFMWWGTDHQMCRDNFNLMWALPLHLPVSFLLFRQRQWVCIYFRYVFFYTLALLLAWYFIPQQFNNALLPLAGIIAVRSYFISKPNFSFFSARKR